jgi:citrate lyase subunit beta/citryl-CoA lyase
LVFAVSHAERRIEGMSPLAPLDRGANIMAQSVDSCFERPMDHRPRRSALYTPASNPRAVEKARGLDCDVIILDLEDAVAPLAKAEARAFAARTVQAGGFGPREVMIRCNGLDTPWGAEDLAVAAQCAPDAVLVPKIKSPADVAAYDAALAGAPAGTALWAMIETCQAALALESIAACRQGGRLAGFCLGLNDLALAMGASQTAGRPAFQTVLTLTVLAGRAHGLSLLDGVFTGLDDPEGLAAECAQGAVLGFDGKTLIHPNQVEICNRAFGPDPDRLAQARAIIAAFADPANTEVGALRVSGQMVERLHLAQALRLVAADTAIRARAETGI